MRILIIKTSSLGDVAHMLPAITDAARQIQDLQIDWLVEESFRALPAWHPAVDQVFPVAIRRWRKNLLQKKTYQEISALKHQLRSHQYDLILDTQGLVKSALLTRLPNKTQRAGYDRHSSREPLSHLFYDRTFAVSREHHAIDRNRQLTANALAYSLENLPLDYGLDDWKGSLTLPEEILLPEKYCLALHGTSRPDKEWPEKNWISLGQKLANQNRPLVFPWGNEREHQRAKRLAEKTQGVVLPKLDLNSLAAIISNANYVIGMDTGLMHIAAALGKPGVAIYLTSEPRLTGVMSAKKYDKILSLFGQRETSVENVFATL